MDHSQKSATLKWTLHKNWRTENKSSTKIRDLKTGSKLENYNVIFHTRSVANEFTRKLLKNLIKLHFLNRK